MTFSEPEKEEIYKVNMPPDFLLQTELILPSVLCDSKYLSSWYYDLPKFQDPEANEVTISYIADQSITGYFQINQGSSQVTINEDAVDLERFPVGSFRVNIILTD